MLLQIIPQLIYKLSKTQLHKIGQSGRFLGRRLGPLLKIGLSLMKNTLKQLAKSVLISLELTAAASATDAAIHKKCLDLVRVLRTSQNGQY